MHALDILNKRLAAPKQWKVVTTYADGSVREHLTETRGQAETYVAMTSGKIGKTLIDRETGEKRTVISIEIEKL